MPRDIGFGVGDAVDPVDVDQERRPVALGAVHLVEDVAIVAIGEERFRRGHRDTGTVVAELVVGRERGAVEALLQLGGEAAAKLALGERGFVGELVPLAVIGILDPAIGLAQRRHAPARPCRRSRRKRRARHSWRESARGAAGAARRLRRPAARIRRRRAELSRRRRARRSRRAGECASQECPFGCSRSLFGGRAARRQVLFR